MGVDIHLMIRWLKFNSVGAVGAGVQLAVLAALVELDVHYLVATALAVETALLHNYAWHVHWTWRDRFGNVGFSKAAQSTEFRRALLRFHLANGSISIVANVALMKVFAGYLEIPILPANAMAILLTSIVNYLVGDKWVFAGSKQPAPRPAPNLRVSEVGPATQRLTRIS